MILRPASHTDAPTLAALGRDSFCAAFEHLYTPGDLATFLQEVYSEKVVAREIADPRCIHRLAEDEDALIGFCKLIHPSPYAAHSDAANPIALGQLYTAPGRTGEGIGAALMDWAEAEARERDHDAIQLSVWSENRGAQAFYARYGFAKIADIDFWVGSHRDDEWLLELRL
ncbi:GNAT family N-acetyltransferase [Erythrobacter sp. LQ02-29]|uniref:GNAT family N-acetyltransferase n=1 Tax=Erythrobacter sp. LQ02-29 TaxID=2920384 RepID=UPI001F4E1550|nr:GNAT family N-acetyltransferase [Erythrobacter sp. LQ02-29]MCP9221634.1 GNAT family N-acetyltransferase [Erythrobacter sp. LQ02-29]